MFDMYAACDNQFIFAATVSADYVCDLTGIDIVDLNESITERGFVEFERSRKLCALIVPQGSEIPATARA